MTINADKFSEIAASLRQYRRAELEDFQESIDAVSPIDAFYVDPLPSDAILKTMLQNNTTFLVGRKGTGKSTVFAKSQFELRKKTDVISVYVDVKSLHEVLTLSAVALDGNMNIDTSVLQAHQLKKAFLASILTELINELGKVYDKQSLVKRWTSNRKGRGYSDVIKELEELAQDVTKGKLTNEEIPLLQSISSKATKSKKKTRAIKQSAGAEGKIGLTSSFNMAADAEKFDESIADDVLYQKYADVVLRSFPFQKILSRIKELLVGVKLKLSLIHI